MNESCEKLINSDTINLVDPTIEEKMSSAKQIIGEKIEKKEKDETKEK